MIHFRNHFFYFSSKIKRGYLESYVFGRRKSDKEKSYIKEVVVNGLGYRLPMSVSMHTGHYKSIANDFMS